MYFGLQRAGLSLARYQLSISECLGLHPSSKTLAGALANKIMHRVLMQGRFDIKIDIKSKQFDVDFGIKPFFWVRHSTGGVVKLTSNYQKSFMII